MSIQHLLNTRTLSGKKNMNEELQWKKYPVLNDGFICLVDVMGDDSAIVQAARVSYGKDEHNTIELKAASKILNREVTHYHYNFSKAMATYSTKDNPSDIFLLEFCGTNANTLKDISELTEKLKTEQLTKDRNLIRRLMKDQHTSPFEMVEFKFKVRVPMDCWRQWIRHRTANVNEYSTRYSEAIDSQQTTDPTQWRMQSINNKQGSSGFLEEWPEEARYDYNPDHDSSTLRFKNNCSLTELDYKGELTPGKVLSKHEEDFLWHAKELYKQRLLFGVAREQARKDLPLSTYTEAYWKCDLHNIFNFLRLRMDNHAQLEIRLYAQAMYEIVKQVCPIACEAFEDYVLNARKFSKMEMELLRLAFEKITFVDEHKPSSMTDNEWKSFLEKLT